MFYKLYDNCNLCPRSCGINRNSAELGFCGKSSDLYVAKAYAHMWEEPCLSGTQGSGTVFFSGCNLKCVYCQNYKISSNEIIGKMITAEHLAQIYLELEQKRVNNINLVTPTHYLPHIIESINLAKQKKINIPFVYNTSGYEKADVIKLLEGYIDIYLTDIKYYSNVYARRYSHADNYFKYAIDAATEMLRQTGKPQYNENGLLKSGVIIRHLVLPDMTYDSKRILRKLFEKFGNDVIYSIMSQFTPINIDNRYVEINRKITQDEYDDVLLFAEQLGIESFYKQIGEAAKESFIPDFDLEGI